MIRSVEASPSGNWFRVTVMEKPFSYVTQVSSFGGVDQVWDASGKVVATLGRRVLRDESGDDDDDAATRAQNDTSKRNVEWLASGDGIYFLQGEAASNANATEEGGAQRQRTRDRLYLWNAPFDSASRKVMLENNSRMSEAAFSADGKTAFIAENANGTAHVFAIDVSDPAKRYTLTRVRGLQASIGLARGFGGGGGGGRGGRGADSVTFFQNPGTLVTERGAGKATVLTSND